MSISISVVTQLLQALPNWRPQMYFKSSLTALSHAMEDLVLASETQTLVIASFQRERFYRQEAHRYRRIADKTDQVYVLAAPEADFKNSSEFYETIAFTPDDSLAQEWHLVVIGDNFTSCLICRERIIPNNDKNDLVGDTNRRFEGIWTFDRDVSLQAATLLLDRIVQYRPELIKKITKAKKQYLQVKASKNKVISSPLSNPDPFVQRLVSYLQASQYKLLKANRSLATKEHKERLINSIITAIRRSLDPEEILELAVQKLGEGLGICRCIVYRCKETDKTAQIEHEFISPGINSLKGQTLPLQHNPLFHKVLELGESIHIDDAKKASNLKSLVKDSQEAQLLSNLVQKCSIFSLLLVPVIYQGRLLGIIELHHCGPEATTWREGDITLVNAIATQIGVALIQAEAYANLEELNAQLEALERTRSNLVAITGHELRTPLSTIQICLESLVSEPDMPPELREVMLSTALSDGERMRKLIQDFLTLSQLESGRIEWHLEPICLEECIELAISNVRAHRIAQEVPNITINITINLPLVQADGEWLVEVLSKLLDNACKFSSIDAQVTIIVTQHSPDKLQVTIADTGRGIEPSRLETVFDLFYQEEGALRRSTGGTGLGLPICRQIVNGWEGEIWAESPGKNQGSQFHFTIPIFAESKAKLMTSNVYQDASKNKKPNRNRTVKGRKKP